LARMTRVSRARRRRSRLAGHGPVGPGKEQNKAMHQLGFPVLLAEIPGWGTGLAFVAAIVGGILVSRKFAANEAFADSHVTMGVLGFVGLIALGSLVPGLFLDMDGGARFLLGLGLAIMGLGGWLASREMLQGRLVPALCLLYVALAAVAFWLQPQLYFDSGDGTRAMLLIASTFVVPLSLGRLVAMGLGMEDLSLRMGAVLTAITLALWPMAKEVVVQSAEKWAHEEAVKKWEVGSKSYPVTAEAREALKKSRPKLTVHYLAGGRDAVKTRPASKAGASVGKPVEKPAEKPADKPDEKPEK